jgi:hypothetical protein
LSVSRGGIDALCLRVREREKKREEKRKEIGRWRGIEEGTVGKKERVHALTQWEARGKTCVMSSALPRIINRARALGRQSKASSGPRFVERLLIRVEDEIIHGECDRLMGCVVSFMQGGIQERSILSLRGKPARVKR